MRALSLSIAGRLVDLPASGRGLVRLTQARAALAELDARQGEYSWPLSLPATRTNARVFGVAALHPLGLDKFRAVDFPFELRCEAEIFTGTFRLSSLRGGYTGQLLGAGFSWALALGERKLPDLNFTPVAYNGTQLAAILAKDCDATDLQFPLLSFGNFYAPPLRAQQPDGSYEDAPNPPGAVLDYPLSVDDYPPGVYLRNVLRQIFAQIGWSLSGRVLDEPQWRATVLTCAGAALATAWPWGALLPAAASGAGSSQFSYFAAGPTADGDRFTNSALGFAEPAPCGNIDGLDLGGEVFFLPVPVPAILSGGTRALSGPDATFTAPIAGVFAFAYSAALASGQQRILIPPLTNPTAAQRARFADVKLALFIRRGGEAFDAAALSGAPADPAQVPHFIPLGPAFGGGGGTQSGTGNIIPQTVSGSASGVYLDAGDSVQLVVIARRRLVDLPTDVAQMTRAEFVINFGPTAFACTSYADNDGLSRTMTQPSAFLPPLLQKEVVKAFLKLTDTVPVADLARRTVHLLTRAELRAAAGPPLDLSAVVDPDAAEYAPTCGAGVGALVFSAAANEDPLLSAGSDTVRLPIGPGAGEQAITGLFAPVALRPYRLAGGEQAAIPTLSDAAGLATPRSETAWDIAGQAPRLVRYGGPHATLRVPFGVGSVPLATAYWDGALAWAGPQGAVATYYADTLLRATRGHVLRIAAALTPALYRALTPGRRVLVQGAAYSVETVAAYDLADDAAATQVELLREL